MTIFSGIRRHLILCEGNKKPHYFFRKKWPFISEAIKRHYTEAERPGNDDDDDDDDDDDVTDVEHDGNDPGRKNLTSGVRSDDDDDGNDDDDDNDDNDDEDDDDDNNKCLIISSENTFFLKK